MSARSRRVVTGLALTAVLVATPGEARAASSVESGWWTSAPVAVAPDLADDQLLVQGGADPSQPLAYAGVSFTLAPGEVAETLLLEVSPDSASTPGATLELCPLESPATSAAGEPAADGPGFDCTSSVDAEPSSDGASYRFDVRSLATGTAVDVAVVPTQSTDRVVLTKPAVDALQTTSSPRPTTTLPPDTSGGGEPDPTADTGSDDFAVPDTGSDLDIPTDPVATDGEAGAPAVDATPPVVDPSTPVASLESADGGADSFAAFGFIGLALAAAVLWAVAGQGDSERLDVDEGALG